jgi:hypothetical protein
LCNWRLGVVAGEQAVASCCCQEGFMNGYFNRRFADSDLARPRTS